jgi:gluconokinase
MNRAVAHTQQEQRQAEASSAPPAVVLIGVSGSGKTTVGALLAKRLGWIFADGDRFHSPENIAKMMALKPLTDADRSPWLSEIGGWIDQEGEQRQACVIACSALKRVYRDVLCDGRPQVRLVYLVVPSERLRSRMLAREGHMFAADMLASQLAILERPTADEGVYQVRSMPTPAQTVDAVIESAHLAPFVVARTADLGR